VLLPVVAYEPVADIKLFTFWSFDCVYAFNDAVTAFMLLIDILTDALLVSKLLTLWLLEEVYALNDAVVAKLPVSIAAATTLTLNVDASPFVKVIVLPDADAVTNELAVIADVT
jgi:hypothetical protein